MRDMRANSSGGEPDMHRFGLGIPLGLAISIGAGIAVQNVVFANAVFAQENRGTLQQQLACTSDVFRLCSEQMPDTNRIVACLRQNTDQLSGPCHAVFESNASVPDQPAPGRSDNRPRPYGNR
jgi:hypothetical protein